MGETLPGLPEQVGRYRVVRLLGRGGMGAVFLAEDPELGRPVALKVPRLGPADGPQVLERFHREARAAATLHHPNICPVYDVGEVGGVPYLAMAFVEGKALSEVLRGGKPVPARRAAALVRKLALALQEAHARGVVHRDLKPANVMIDRRGEPVIMDFGLARLTSPGETRLTQDGSVLGTPAYMAPEQVLGDVEAMGPACDVYALGVILYELLTGRLPFEGPTAAVLGQVALTEPPRPSQHRPDLDPGLEAVCLKAMAKKPADRYPDMAALAAALTDYLRATGSRATPPPGGSATAVTAPATVADAAAPGSRPRGRLPRGVLAAAALAVVAAALGGGYLLTRPKDRSVTETNAAAPPVSGAPAGGTAAPPAEILDYYARGLPGQWQPMADSRGHVLTGGFPALAPDGLELVVQRRRKDGLLDEGGLYLARRPAVTEPFGEPVYQPVFSTARAEGQPAFARDGLTLFVGHPEVPPGEKATRDTPRTVWRARRPDRRSDFGPPEPVPGMPLIWLGGTRFSPGERVVFLISRDKKYCRAVRQADGSYYVQVTNLPVVEPGKHSGAWAVAASDSGAIVFTQVDDGKVWLNAARPRGGPKLYEIERLRDLELPNRRHMYTMTMTADARLLVGWMENELIAMRLPESVRQQVLRVLDR